MSVKTIETRAIISAQDKTGATFASVARNLKHIESTAASASRRIDSVARGMSAVGIAKQRHDDIARRMSSIGATAPIVASRLHGNDMASLTRIAAAVAGSAVVIGVAKTVAEKVVNAAAARSGERLSQDIAGITPKEQKDIAFAGYEVSRRHQSITATDAEAMVRDARTITGDTKTAIEISDTLARMRVVLTRLYPDGDANKSISDFVRAADLTGATKDPTTFRAYADNFAKIQGAFPGSVSPLEMVEFAKKSHGAAMKYSPEFATGVVPSLIQSSGGATTGEMLASFNRNIVDERIDKEAKKKLAAYGLVKGGHIVDRDLAASDPYLWTRKVLMSGMARHGVTDAGKQATIAGSLFSDSTAAEVVKRFIEQSENIERDRQKSREARDLRQSDDIEKRDLGTAWQGVKSQADNVAATFGERLVPAATSAAISLANLLHSADERLSGHDADYGKAFPEPPTGIYGAFRNLIDENEAARGRAHAWNNKTPLSFNAPKGSMMRRVAPPATMFQTMPSGSVAPGLLAFGPDGASGSRSLRIAPGDKDINHLGAALRGASQQVELKGSAGIDVRVHVEMDEGIIARKIDQRIDARGALRTDSGVSMAPR